jgi:hypothetical protein
MINQWRHNSWHSPGFYRRVQDNRAVIVSRYTAVGWRLRLLRSAAGRFSGQREFQLVSASLTPARRD